MSAESYLSRGVSPTKDDVKKAVANQSKGVAPGAFCKLIEDIAGDDDYCVAIHADGAGTKSSVAYLMYKETGNYDWFKGLAQDSLVMNTDDLACVGCCENLVLSNTIGRNAHLVDGKAIAKVIEGYNEMVEKLNSYGVGIKMCGGETADVGDLVRTMIVDSTIVARIKRSDVINAANIKPGHVIVGLASFGQATYEDSEILEFYSKNRFRIASGLWYPLAVMCAGCIAYELAKNIKNTEEIYRHGITLRIAEAAIYLLTIVYISSDLQIEFEYPMFMLLTIAVAISFSGGTDDSLLSHKIFSFLGRASFPLYLFHEAISLIYIELLNKHGINHGYLSHIILYILCIVIAFLAQYVYDTIKKNKTQIKKVDA